uniref:Putative primase n=1 Tax=viral metagenome TaxID=1070528 RepID=A0A6M3KBI4_9ZZZZ
MISINDLNLNYTISHCKNNFYREFAYKTVPGIDKPNKDGLLLELRRDRRDPIRSRRHLDSKLFLYKSRPGVYISVYSFEELHTEDVFDNIGTIRSYKGSVIYDSAKLNRIYFDFDYESDPQKAIDESLLVIKSLAKHGIFCHCYFSGSKGIAMYIEFKTVDVQPENKKDVLKLFLDTVIETVKSDYGHDLTCLDYKVSFDLARVSRIPNTKHKSGLYCVPVSFGDMRKGLDYIRLMAQEPSTKDLDNLIISCMFRNTRMETIIHNAEQQVILNRTQKDKEQELKHLHFEKNKKFWKNSDTALSDDQISHARHVPLSSLIGHDSRQRCPIHGGDNPTSFYIDHTKNYWYCHSCSAGGDSIAYMMKRNNLNFKEAVLSLIG